MVIRARENLIGAWAFLIGIIIALAVGLFTGLVPGISKTNSAIMLLLAVLGLIQGYFVSEKDVRTFLLASVSVVIVSSMGIQGIVLGAAISGFNVGIMFSSILQSLLALFVPAAIVVAIKTVFSISQS